jgi:hypothetical protein
MSGRAAIGGLAELRTELAQPGPISESTPCIGLLILNFCPIMQLVNLRFSPNDRIDISGVTEDDSGYFL